MDLVRAEGRPRPTSSSCCAASLSPSLFLPCAHPSHQHTCSVHATHATPAHTLQVKGVDPYVVHLTWTYNGTPGKRSRMRDMGLWHDPPEYYAQGSFVTVDVTLPEVRAVPHAAVMAIPPRWHRRAAANRRRSGAGGRRRGLPAGRAGGTPSQQPSRQRRACLPPPPFAEAALVQRVERERGHDFFLPGNHPLPAAAGVRGHGAGAGRRPRLCAAKGGAAAAAGAGFQRGGPSVRAGGRWMDGWIAWGAVGAKCGLCRCRCRPTAGAPVRLPHPAPPPTDPAPTHTCAACLPAVPVLL